MKKIWHVSAGGLQNISSLPALEDFLCQQRQVIKGSGESFFAPVYERDIHDPHLLHGMGEAVDRMYYAIEHGERILVYGDYDVDGISSTAIVASILQELGAKVIPYLPHRMDDGYSLNRGVLEQLRDEFDLLITVDCGVSNIEEIAWLKEQGKDSIIVDHHEMRNTLPAARAILHPRHPEGKYPWPHLSGAGVSFKLAQGLLRDKRSVHAGNGDREKWLLDLALLGTVGDVMPLLGENRAIVRFGLQVVRLARRPGIRALIDAARLSSASLTVEDLAFRAIPLINAAGRIDHPQAALDVLLAVDDKRAQEAAMKLVVLNQQRQSITRRIVREAAMHIDPASPIIFAANFDWPAGIVGLVAGQLAGKLKKPAFIIGGNGQHGVGSARTANGINILQGLRTAEQHALKLGGHAQAAGFSVDQSKLTAFREALEEYFAAGVKDAGQTPHGYADAHVHTKLLEWETISMLQKFEPFGEANPKPKFLLRDLAVVDQRPVGKEGKHIKLRLRHDAGHVEAIGFGLAQEAASIKDRADLIGCLEVNEFRGNASLQLSIKDIAAAGEVDIREAS